MSNPIAGWYSDPAGAPNQLRYWDGTKWTDSVMDASAATQPPQPGTEANANSQPDATGVAGGYSAPYTYADAPLYYVSPQDSTLRLVAFILALVSTVTAAWAIIPLAWMIPMTVMTWGIYKGKRPNTVAFGVCSLIFLNLVGGVLLLVSTKDE